MNRSRITRAAAIALLTSPLSACGDPEQTSPPPPPHQPSWNTLATPFGWEALLDASEDPFSHTRPEGWVCDEEGYRQEDFGGEPGFDLDTTYCDPITARHTTVSPILAGDPVRFRIWNGALTASGETDARAVLVLMFGDEVALRRELLIPRGGTLNTWEFTLERDAPLGTPIYWHVSNHGANTYTFLSAEVFN